MIGIVSNPVLVCSTGNRIQSFSLLLSWFLIDSDSKQNKGTILKSSVDYIRRLKKERERMKEVEIENRTLQETNRQLSLKLQVRSNLHLVLILICLLYLVGLDTDIDAPQRSSFMS